MTVPRRYVLVAIMFSLSVLLYVDRVCISAAKEAIARDLALSEREMGWVLSAFALGYALFQTPGGYLADRWGPRRLLAAIAIFWSLFTGLTAAASRLGSLLVARFCFGLGEAGAFPGIARATFSWIPMRERGLVQGVNFSGSRIGAAFALPAVAGLMESLGWRTTFIVLMLVGFVWAVLWYRWFRDEPEHHPGVAREELDLIRQTRQGEHSGTGSGPGLSLTRLVGSANIWLVCAQYFSSNFTFFFCLTWLFPHLKSTYSLELVEAGLYSSAPLLCGALGNWFAGWLVDFIYRGGRWKLSRQLPAMLGFALAGAGLLGSVQAQTALSAVVCLSVAIFGADMTLSPSWSLCIDIGQRHAGVVSGTMNMAGNIGSFVTALAFPYLAEWTGSHTPFFFVATGLNAAAIVVWLLVDPRRSLEG